MKDRIWIVATKPVAPIIAVSTILGLPRNRFDTVCIGSDPNIAASKHQLLNPVVEAEVLVLDELGAQKPSPWVNEILYLVMNSRYTRRLPTLFTTNFRLSSSVEPDPLDRTPSAGNYAALSSRISASLLSRLYEMARPVEIDVEDFRRVVQMQKHRV